MVYKRNVLIVIRHFINSCVTLSIAAVMELLLGVIVGVVISFLALYLTKKLLMAEKKLQHELQQEHQNERLLLEISDQLRTMQQVHRPRAP